MYVLGKSMPSTDTDPNPEPLPVQATPIPSNCDYYGDTDPLLFKVITGWGFMVLTPHLIYIYRTISTSILGSSVKNNSV